MIFGFTHWFQFGFADFCLLLILFQFVILFFLQSEQIHVPQCICVRAACRINYGGKKAFGLKSDQNRGVFFSSLEVNHLCPRATASISMTAVSRTPPHLLLRLLCDSL